MKFPIVQKKVFPSSISGTHVILLDSFFLYSAENKSSRRIKKRCCKNQKASSVILYFVRKQCFTKSGTTGAFQKNVAAPSFSTLYHSRYFQSHTLKNFSQVSAGCPFPSDGRFLFSCRCKVIRSNSVCCGSRYDFSCFYFFISSINLFDCFSR